MRCQQKVWYNIHVKTDRTVEPMTLAFKWRFWYLYGHCRLREDYRIFRLGRIQDVSLLDRRFKRRKKSFDQFSEETAQWQSAAWIDFILKFDPFIRPIIEEFYPEENREEQPDGSLVIRTSMPEDGWVYGLILSYGKYAEVLAPKRLRTEDYRAVTTTPNQRVFVPVIVLS